MKKIFLPKQTKKFFQTYDAEVSRYQQAVLRAVNDLAQMAWENGIKIVSIELMDSFVEKGRKGLLYGADRMVIPAPKIKRINTEFMDIKVK